MLAFLVLVSTALADPLFDRMAGNWIGEGERVFLVSGRKVRIESQVSSTLEEGKLVSSNRIQETPGRSYSKTYWIRPSVRTPAPGSYELGSGDRVGSEGSLDQNRFSVTQVIGSIRVESVTEFLDTESVYTEKVWNEQRLVSEAHVRYRRAE